jgi:CBS domain-containing protein
MNVNAILKSKGTKVVTVRPEATVAALTERLRVEGIGALVVSEDGKTIAGIVSERDIVRGLAEHGAAVLERKVADIMHRDVVTLTGDEDIGAVMGKMTHHRIRHLPVVENGKLCGIISIGDAVKHRLDELELEASAMRHYIAGH